MLNKKYISNILVIFIIFTCMFLIPFISAIPPFQSSGDNSLDLEIPYSDYHKQNMDLGVHVHIHNSSDGLLVSTNIASCYYHLYNHNEDILEVQTGNLYPYENGFNATVDQTYFNDTGLYSVLVWCNTSSLGGYRQYSFFVNNGGVELTISNSINFNSAMLLLMGLWIVALIGIFTIGDYRGKFALYWVIHILFVVGTFSVWKFSETYEVGFLGLSGIFKILFYVSTIAVFPMVILSIAWIFYIHTMNDTIKGFIERGMDEDEAFDRSRRKRRW